ncbi:MAG: right-handed parallel beta-helix repeat-containing protein, partial [Ignavibacteria bacterium]|nr:right-handed parallel beta-helix repeat-containing protein [Ignavibacteria bacterium]
MPSEYGTIQEAVDDAQPGDVIMIDDGFFFETINLSGRNNITIKGKNGREDCLIIGGTIYGDSSTHHITIEGLTLLGSNYAIDFSSGEYDIIIRNCKLDDFSYGIALNNALNIKIENCIIQNGNRGITAQNSSGIKICHCRIFNLYSALVADYDSNLEIFANEFDNITFQAAYSKDSNCTFNSNKFSNSQYGIYIYSLSPVIKNSEFNKVKHGITMRRSYAAITNIKINIGYRG